MTFSSTYVLHLAQTGVSIAAWKPLVCVLNEIAALEAQCCMCRRANINHRRSRELQNRGPAYFHDDATVRTWTRVETDFCGTQHFKLRLVIFTYTGMMKAFERVELIVGTK